MTDDDDNLVLDHDALRQALVGVTPGEWWPGCLSRDESSCNCVSVLSLGHAGSVATVQYDNGLPLGEGGNDAPPLDEAKANLRFIGTFNPVVALALLDERDRLLQRISHLEGSGD